MNNNDEVDDFYLKRDVEDMVKMKISRNPDRCIFTISVRNLSKEDAEKAIRYYRKKLKGK